MLEHEKLRVFHAAQLLLKELQELKKLLKPGYGRLMSEVIECAESVVLNVGEACGDGRPGKKAHHFRIAGGSNGECAAGVASLVNLGALPRKPTFKATGLLHCIGRMVHNLAIYYENIPDKTTKK